MFGWFRKKDLAPQEFADNATAFAHACKLGYEPRIGAVIPGLVEEEGRPGRDGERVFLLRLAAKGGERRAWGSLLKGSPGAPAPGDFIGFHIVRIASELPADAELIGYVACTLVPIALGSQWRIDRSLTPANLKPELHM